MFCKLGVDPFGLVPVPLAICTVTVPDAGLPSESTAFCTSTVNCTPAVCVVVSTTSKSRMSSARDWTRMLLLVSLIEPSVTVIVCSPCVASTNPVPAKVC